MNGMGISKVKGIEKDCSFGLDWLMVNDIKEKPRMNELNLTTSLFIFKAIKKGHFSVAIAT